jgi:hypothetical protein
MLRIRVSALVLIGLLAALPAAAGDRDPLFVSLTTDEHHRVDMATMFSKAMLDRGHPITIWLTDRAVFLTSDDHAGPHAAQRQALADLIAAGAIVIVCPFCMKQYAVDDTRLLAGARIGNPDFTKSLLFADDSRTLSW